ncbi:MAG: repeat-containing protein, partial [Planctomycetaceae bacterium]|nr:repeat-containing protein [Planctomycetaceae bacterium]
SRFSWTVTLPPGKHQLVAKALSAKSAGLSDDLEVEYAKERAELPRLFVLAIGISAYQREDLRRAFPAKDAQAIAAEFAKADTSAFSEVQVHLLQDQQVTRLELTNQFEWLQQNMTANDVCCIYLGGRGERDAEGTLYLQHQESRPGDAAAGLSEKHLANYLQKTPGKLLLMLDVIDHSGNQTGNAAIDSRSLSDFVRLLDSDEYGVSVISAVGGRELPRDMSAGGHSAFAQAILNGLSGKADTNSDGAIDNKELGQFVRANVKSLTNDGQRPVVSHPSLVEKFSVFRLPR